MGADLATSPVRPRTPSSRVKGSQAVFVHMRPEFVARAFFLSENPCEDDDTIIVFHIPSRSRRASPSRRRPPFPSMPPPVLGYGV